MICEVFFCTPIIVIEQLTEFRRYIFIKEKKQKTDSVDELDKTICKEKLMLFDQQPQYTYICIVQLYTKEP